MYQFLATVRSINNKNIIIIPEKISLDFPTRGMLMAKITILNQDLILPLEPTGYGNHYFNLDSFIENKILSNNLAYSKLELIITIDINQEWTEPILSDDIYLRFTELDVMKQWNSLTVKAKWEWVRFIQAATKESTRIKRILTVTDMLIQGKRRPCCFDTSRCSDPSISKSGKLLL